MIEVIHSENGLRLFENERGIYVVWNTDGLFVFGSYSERICREYMRDPKAFDKLRPSDFE